jgi:hypothetical protein
MKERDQLERPRHRWDDHIKIDLKEIGLKGHGLIRDMDKWWTLVNTVAA